jgi:hypothetical protein
MVSEARPSPQGGTPRRVRARAGLHQLTRKRQHRFGRIAVDTPCQVVGRGCAAGCGTRLHRACPVPGRRAVPGSCSARCTRRGRHCRGRARPTRLRVASTSRRRQEHRRRPGRRQERREKLLPVSLVRPPLCAAAPCRVRAHRAPPAGQRKSIRQRQLTLRARDHVPYACKECTMTHADPAWRGCPRLVSPLPARDGCRACPRAVRPG